MRFEEYHIASVLKRNLAELGFRRPTDIQFKSIPSVLKGEDVLAIAQTGTGKTAAYVIPVVDRLLRKRIKDRKIRCLVMVPTHELAIQVADVFKQLSRGTKLKILALIGGVDQDPQIRHLRDGIDILVATPGRLFDLKSQGHLSISDLEILILDEADHMLDLGFIKDIRDVIKVIPKKRQTLFYSATIDKKIKKLAYSLVSNPIRIQISPRDPVTKNVYHEALFIEMDDKRFYLERLVKENPDAKVLVFVRTKVRAERVLKAMDRVGIQSRTIHGDKVHADRMKVLDQFKRGEVGMLIATDVSARGIDIPDVDFVVNYDLPDQPETYVHRIGRTGRGSRRGHAVSFCSEGERPLLSDIQEYLGGSVPVFELSMEDTDTTRSQSLDFTLDIEEELKSIRDLEKRKKKSKRSR